MKVGNTTIRFVDETMKELPKEYEQFVHLLEPIKLKKGQYIIRENEVEHYLYFIEKGIFRYVTNDENGEEKSFWFSFEGEFINSYKSFLTGVPSEFSIQAVTNSTLWRINRERVLSFFEISKEISNTARHVMEDIFTRKIDHEVLLLKYKPEERYRKFMIDEPQVMNKVPLKYIASYLGITPQSLSRIRNRLAKESLQ